MNTSSSPGLLSWAEGRRQRAWELHQQGWTQARIAEALGSSQAAVSLWLHRAQLGGLAALRRQPGSGRPPLLSGDQLSELAEWLTQPASLFGFRGDVWT